VWNAVSGDDVSREMTLRKMILFKHFFLLVSFIEQRNILHEIIKRKANWIGHTLRRNCLLKQVIEGNIKEDMEVKRRREEDVRSYWMTLRTGEDILI